MTEIKVLMFASFKEQAGFASRNFSVPPGSSIEHLKTTLQRDFQLSLNRGTIALNQKVVSAATLLSDGDEVAFLPPVSGGEERTQWLGITEDKLPFQEMVEWAAMPECGAICSFLGTTRTPNKGLEVIRLEYEVFPEMAQSILLQIAQEIREKWEVGRIGILHRTGNVFPKESSVAIVISAPNRGNSFEACRFALERIKQILPVWKKEILHDGSVWVDGENSHQL